MGIAFFAWCVASLVSLQAQPGGLGRIAFPTSGPAEARKHFDRGVLFLHSFEYREAREQFLAAQKMAPAFAMAYWGEAMTYNEPVWFAQDRDAGRSALKRLPVKAPTGRETRVPARRPGSLWGRHEGRAGLQRTPPPCAVCTVRVIADDPEAAAFYALSLIGTCHRGRDLRTYMKAAAVAEAVLEKNPEHPGALHYAIHAYRRSCSRAVGSSGSPCLRERSRRRRPMPNTCPLTSFSPLGMWDEAARSNEAAWKAIVEPAADRVGRIPCALVAPVSGTCSRGDLRRPGGFSS